MNIRNIYILLFFISLPVFTTGQDIKKKTINLSAGYFNDLIINHGYQVGAGYSLLNWQKERQGSKMIRTKDKRLDINLNYFSYNHADNYNGIAFYPELNYSISRPKGFYTDLSLGAGYHRTDLKGSTFRVDETQNVSEINNAGRHHLLLLISCGIGIDMGKSTKLPVTINFSPTVFLITPEQWDSELHMGMEIELKYYINLSKSKNEKK